MGLSKTVKDLPIVFMENSIKRKASFDYVRERAGHATVSLFVWMIYLFHLGISKRFPFDRLENGHQLTQFNYYNCVSIFLCMIRIQFPHHYSTIKRRGNAGPGPTDRPTNLNRPSNMRKCWTMWHPSHQFAVITISWCGNTARFKYVIFFRASIA